MEVRARRAQKRRAADDLSAPCTQQRQRIRKMLPEIWTYPLFGILSVKNGCASILGKTEALALRASCTTFCRGRFDAAHIALCSAQLGNAANTSRRIYEPITRLSDFEASSVHALLSNLLYDSPGRRLMNILAVHHFAEVQRHRADAVVRCFTIPL